jgi:hypothetical protein
MQALSVTTRTAGKRRRSVQGRDAHTFNITTPIKKEWVGFKLLPTHHFMREEMESLYSQPPLQGQNIIDSLKFHFLPDWWLF